MAELSAANRFAQELAAQDPLAQSEAYAAHRRQLEDQLVRLTKYELWTSRIAALAAVLSLVLMFVGGSQAFGSFDPTDRDATIFSIALAAIYVVSSVTWPLALATYFSRLRPRIRETKDQLLRHSLCELQLEMRTLRREIQTLSATR